jgi:hypothetical protein
MSSDADVDAAAVKEYVATVRSALAEAPSMSARTAELRVTQPLLDVLGWDLHGGAVVAGFDTAAGEVGFALRADGRPRALVETVAPDDGMAPADGERLLDAMRAADVDRGLLLDGHELAVLALRDGERDHRRVALTALPEHRDLLARFTPEALAADERTAAAHALADRREALAADLTDRLLTATEGRCEAPLGRAAERFLDRVIRELDPDALDGSGSAEGSGAEHEASDDEATEAPEEAADGDDEGSDTDAPRAAAATEGPAPTDQTAATAEPDADDEGEFVVRFFDGSHNVGAVGGSAPLSALLQACQHLQRQRAVFRGLSTPWAPDEADRPVLTDEAGDGPTRQLPTGHHLRTDMDREEIGATMEGLAGEAGLRVMLQGDW